jgi:DNA-directed RNA polymerase subunit RPC12/RpoP
MQTLGTDKVLGMSYLKKDYNALGSFLHLSTIRQLEDGSGFNAAKCRKLCTTVVAALEEVLSSRVFNSTIGNFSEIECMRCDRPVRKRMPHGRQTVDAQCFECGAEYRLEEVGEQVTWKPKQDLIPCANQRCGQKIAVWTDEQKVGANWQCPSCGQRSQLALGVFAVDKGGSVSEEGLTAGSED